MSYCISKYNYTNIESDTQLYVFELILTTNTYNNKIFRCIKKVSRGKIDIDDKILFDTINKFKLTVLNINSIDEPIILKKIINHNNDSNTYSTNKIQLEINRDNDLITFLYNII